MGKSLDIQYYDSLHRKEAPQYVANEFRAYESETIDQHMSDDGGQEETVVGDDDSEIETTTEELSTLFESLKHKLQQGNKLYNASIKKFIRRCNNFSDSQQISAFHSFGSVFVGKTKGKIKVQPAAVSRRKSKIGSRQKQDTRKTYDLATRPVKVKRFHSISQAIRTNQQSAKKAGRSMKSIATYPKKRKTPANELKIKS